MKVVILAGGLGTRLAEETEAKPKPMVEIGGRPIVWHIMKHFDHHGYREFVIAAGYKGEVLKRYFIDYHELAGDLTIHLKTGEVSVQTEACEDWLVRVVDTGLETSTGGRVKRLMGILRRETFMLTYGDGVSNVDLEQLLAFHRRHGRVATVTAVRPPARFGGLLFRGDLVAEFTEKPQIGEGWINGGFMVLEPKVFEYIDGDQVSMERDVLERLAAEQQLGAYQHDGFWQCMDTLRDLRLLEKLWQSGSPPWRTWVR